MGKFQIITRRDKKAFLSEKCKNTKCFSEEALQIAEKRREVKGKGEKERYAHQMQNSKEKKGEIRKPSSVINAKK